MKLPLELPQCSIASSCNKATLSVKQLLLLGIIAGAYISLGAFLVTVVTRDLAPIIGAGLTNFVSGAIFPVGLILIVIGGGELFTGNCLMVTAWMDKKIRYTDILRNWAWIYVANFIGALMLALLIFYSGLLEGGLAARTFEIAAAKVNLSFSEIFFRGILCNWLVGLGVWLAAAALSVPGKVIMIWLPIMAFVTGSFEHCIANMYFFSAALLAKGNEAAAAMSGISPEKLEALNLTGCFANLAPATLGNIVGAVVLVGMLYYAVYKRQPDTGA